MEQIDAQVSDLRYLSQAPAALSSAHGSPAAGAGASASASASAHPAYDDAHATAQAQSRSQPQHHHHHQHQQMSPAGSARPGDHSAYPDPAPNAGNANGSAASTPLATPSATGKRKADGGDTASAKQTRSKRNRYISIACNECKRRKIKCNGETPCQRCGNLNLECLYAPNCCSNTFRDSDEFKHINAQLTRLQDEVGYLHQAMRAMQSDTPRTLPPHERLVGNPSPAGVTPSPSQATSSGQRPQDPSHRRSGFRGPTSMAFSLDVANTTIANMGFQSLHESNDETNPHAQAHSDDGIVVAHPDSLSDPLLEYSKDEMIRLCHVHEEEVGIMYPVIDIQAVISHAKSLSSFLDTMRDQQPIHAINDDKTLQLKIVMCCGLVVEDTGDSPRAARLYESMEAVVNRKLIGDEADIPSLPLLCLVAGYRFLSADDILAWRTIGQTSRLCLELGIHQTMGLMTIQNEQERKNALNSFWSAYVLDRRWAFATGLPYVIQDDEIDPKLPWPEEYPFLVAMIAYSRIAAKVWRQVSHFEPVLARELRQEDVEALDREILNWYETVPEDVKMRNWDKEQQLTSTPSYNLQRLRIWTYLRLNQIRIWLYTPILHAATSIMAHPVLAQRVVDLAKDTIGYLNHLNNTTNIYRRNQVFYHQFLTSAISVVFLASVHAPVRFSAVCREEFYIALELVKDLSEKSTVSKRLWRTINKLKDVAPRFGLNPDEDPHSTAALGMIGLARGHPQDQGSDARPPLQQRPPLPSTGGPTQNGATVDQNGSRIQSEMSRIFEGYVSLNGTGLQGDAHGGQRPADISSGGERGIYGQDGTVYPHLKEMF